MRGSRTLAVVAGGGLSALLAFGAAAPASASTASAVTTVRSTAVTARSVTKVTGAAFPGKTPAQVLALSARELKAASSVHVTLHSEEGQSVTDIDLVIGTAGARGTVRSSASGTVQLVRVKSTVYLMGDASFWTSTGLPEKQAAILVGRWVGVSGKGTPVRTLNQVLSLSFWANTIARIKPTQRVAGQVVGKLPTVGLLAGDATLYVAAKGKPYPLMLIHNATVKDTMVLSDWNKRVIFKAPKALAVVTL
jgi:hypothetical protein